MKKKKHNKGLDRHLYTEYSAHQHTDINNVDVCRLV